MFYSSIYAWNRVLETVEGWVYNINGCMNMNINCNGIPVGKPELKSFDAVTAAVQPYQDDDFQGVYFVTESFDDMKERVR